MTKYDADGVCMSRWSAISRGAVLKGLTTSVEDETVTNHIAKFSYGVVYNTEFDPAIHHIADKYLDPISNKYSARSQVQWYLRRVSPAFFFPSLILILGTAFTNKHVCLVTQGENTRKTEPVKHNWLRRLPSKEALGKTTAITIFYSDAKDPPARLTDGTVSPSPSPSISYHKPERSRGSLCDHIKR